MKKVDASYTKAAGPDGVRFKIVPATSPDAGFSILRLLLCAVPAWIVTALVSGVFGQIVFVALSGLGETVVTLLAYVMMVPMTALFFYSWYKSYRWFNAWYRRKQAEGRHAYEVELLVNASGVSVGDANKQFLRHDDIHRLVIKNAFDNSCDIPLTGYVAAGSPMAVGAMAAANAMTNTVAVIANNKRRAMARISYIVTIEAGGVAHPIAGGLTEVCANGVMTDIGRALRNEIA
jgi:hypothetical protein